MSCDVLQLNEITPYLDGGLVYGTSKAWADMLRTFPDGTLAPRGQLAWNQEASEIQGPMAFILSFLSYRYLDYRSLIVPVNY